MGSRVYYSPFIPTFNGNGLPVANARLYFFYTETTDLAPIFQDAGLTIPMDNPVISNGAARYDNIYLNDAITYRVRETGPDGTPLAADIDPYIPGTAPGTATAGFLQAGPDAIEQSAEDKLRNLPWTPEDYGVVPGDAGNQYVAYQAMANYLSALGGGTILSSPGAIYRFTTAPIAMPGVTFDLNGGQFILALSGTNDQGVRLRTGATVCNGRIAVQSTGTPSTQAGVHAPVNVGPIYGAGGTVAAPSDDEGVHSWTLRDLELTSDKWVDNGLGVNIGAVAIQVIGGAHHGKISGIRVPDSARMLGVVHLDWGVLGTLSTTKTAAAQNINKTAYNAGLAYTTHPHDIDIDDIWFGALTAVVNGTDTGSFGIRFSGCYNINIGVVNGKTATNAAFRHTAGDLGAEFMPAALRHLLCQNIIFSGGNIEASLTGYLIYSDSYADNIATAVVDGYTSLVNPVVETNVLFDHIVGKGPGDATANYGIRVIQQNGGVIRDCKANYYKQAYNVDTKVIGLVIERPVGDYSREHGCVIDQATVPPEDIVIIDPLFRENGQNGAFSNPAGLYIANSLRVTVERGRYGKRGAADPVQHFGIRVAAGALGTVIRDPVIQSTKAGGIGISILTGEAHNQFGLLENPRYEASVATNYGGLQTIPVRREPAADGRIISVYKADAAATFTGLTLADSDIIEYTDAVAAGFRGLICTTGGTVGSGAATKTFGAISA